MHMVRVGLKFSPYCHTRRKMVYEVVAPNGVKIAEFATADAAQSLCEDLNMRQAA